MLLVFLEWLSSDKLEFFSKPNHLKGDLVVLTPGFATWICAQYSMAILCFCRKMPVKSLCSTWLWRCRAPQVNLMQRFPVLAYRISRRTPSSVRRYGRNRTFSPLLFKEGWLIATSSLHPTRRFLCVTNRPYACEPLQQLFLPSVDGDELANFCSNVCSTALHPVTGQHVNLIRFAFGERGNSRGNSLFGDMCRVEGDKYS